MKQVFLAFLVLVLAVYPVFSQGYPDTVRRLHMEIENNPSMDFLYDISSEKLVGLEFRKPDTNKWTSLRGDGTILISSGPPEMTMTTAVRGTVVTVKSLHLA